MAKNRKTFGSKKFVATLPYLVAPSDAQIDQMEIQFHWMLVLEWFEDYSFIYEEDDRFLDWMMEIEDAQFNRMTDDYLCLAMERGWRELNTHESKLFRRLERMEDLWFEGGDPNWDLYTSDPRDDDVFHNYTGPDPDDCRDNYQLHSYTDFNYWNDGSDNWDISESQRLFDNSFCPEQALVQEIPLRGLKHPARQELIREYCVA